jgi:lipoprotein-anchoring transpeptidase ErfK/SrfK
MGRRVLLGIGCLLIAGAIGFAFVARRGNDEQVTVVPVTTPPAPVLERVEDLAARIPAGRSVALRARPDGRLLATVPARTEFGSPQTMAVAFRKGDWIAVRSPALGNRRVGWVRRRPLRLVRRPVRLEVDLSRRVLLVREESSVLRTISVAIGAPDTPTPTGRFYVTDKLPGVDFGSYYGCCILALSGRQPNLPEGWSGGDRLAIHGSPTPTWGEAVSNGCLHAPEADLRYLMKTVPLGTTVRVHA